MPINGVVGAAAKLAPELAKAGPISAAFSNQAIKEFPQVAQRAFTGAASRNGPEALALNSLGFG